MPRLPVDGKKVVEHRITLGTKERQLIESYVFANQINQISEPAVEILKDISAMTSLTIAYIIIRYGADIAAQLKGQYDDILELILDVALVLSQNKDFGDIFKFFEFAIGDR